MDKKIEDQYFGPLTEIFSTPAVARVLDFLLLNRNFEYSEADISRLSHTPVRTLQRILPILIDKKLIRATRKSGRSIMYVVNVDSKCGEILLSFFREALEGNITSVIKKQKQLEKTIAI